MTAFQFMANAFYIAVGAICLSVAALVVSGAILGMRNVIKKEKAQGE